MRIVDFTGSTAFGDWLEDNARQAAVYTEKAGVNTVVVDSTDDFAGMLREPRLLAVPLQRADVHDPAEPAASRPTASAPTEGRKCVDEVAADLAAAVEQAARRPDAQAVELLGAIVNDGVLSRVDGAGSLGTVRARRPGR